MGRVLRASGSSTGEGKEQVPGSSGGAEAAAAEAAAAEAGAAEAGAAPAEEAVAVRLEAVAGGPSVGL